MADESMRVPTGWDRKTGRKLAIAAAVIAVLGAGIAAERYKAKRDHQGESWQRAGTAWYQYRRCMLGEQPLAAGETAAQRLRAIFLATRSLNRGVPPIDQGSSDWPSRCSAYKTALAAALRESAPDQGRETFITALGVELELTSPSAMGQADTLFALGQSLGLPTPQRTLDVRLPPAPPVPLRAEQLPAIANSHARVVGSYRVQTARPVILLHSDEQSTVCGFSSHDAGLPFSLSCAAARAKRPVEVLASEPGGPWLVADRAPGEERMVDARTGETRGPYVMSGFARADGTYIGVAPSTSDRKDLIVVRDGRIESRAKLTEDPTVQFEVMGPWLVQEHPSRGMRIEALSLEGARSGDAALAGDSVRAVCLTGTRAALVTQQVPAIGAATLRVWFARDGGWSEPVMGEMGKILSSVHCGDGQVSVVWPDTDYASGTPYRTTVHRTVCTERGCTHSASAGPTTGPQEAPVLHAIDLGTAVAVLWGRSGQPLRMMVAPMERLASTADTVVSDAKQFGGISDEALEVIGVLTGDGAGVVLVHNLDKTMAIGIAADGSFRAMGH